MILYAFMKDSAGNIIRIGEECPPVPQIQKEVEHYAAAGYQPAEAYEYDQQVIGAATKGMVSDPNAPVSSEASAAADFTGAEKANSEVSTSEANLAAGDFTGAESSEAKQ